jgi:hypothetical protein
MTREPGDLPVTISNASVGSILLCLDQSICLDGLIMPKTPAKQEFFYYYDADIERNYGMNLKEGDEK